MRTGIYYIENTINGKKYIGQGTNVEKRMNQKHYLCPALHSAMKKYGDKSFNKKVLIYCEEWELTRLEIECIKIFHSHVSENGYNISWGGQPNSFEIRNKMSKNHSNVSGENNPNFGKNASPETKNKMSENRKGKTAGTNNPMFGKTGRNHPKFGIRPKNPTSTYFGVTKHISKYKNRVYTYWGVTALRKYIGLYKTELEAARAYNEYVIKNNIDCALNFLEK